MVSVARFVFNPFKENTYLVWDSTLEGVVIDPGNNYEREHAALLGCINSKGVKIEAVVATHGHYDHLCGAQYLVEHLPYDVKFALSGDDIEVYENAPYDGERYEFRFRTMPFQLDMASVNRICFGASALEVIPTPGHTIGHVSLFERSSKLLFTGDTLHRGTIGRTDLFTSSYKALTSSIINNLLPLGDDVTIYAVHGPESTIGYERTNNKYLRYPTQEELLNHV